MATAYVGLGANVGDREASIRNAVELLRADPDLDVLAVSTLRETAPVDFLDQPPFLNGAVAVATRLRPRELLERLLAVERALGRERRGPRYGPRTIDLDLFLYSGERVDEPGLRVPHPRLHERAFALEPLHELNPGLEVPDRGSVAALLAGLESP